VTNWSTGVDHLHFPKTCRDHEAARTERPASLAGRSSIIVFRLEVVSKRELPSDETAAISATTALDLCVQTERSGPHPEAT
jgi:hypothetical protein